MSGTSDGPAARRRAARAVTIGCNPMRKPISLPSACDHHDTKRLDDCGIQLTWCWRCATYDYPEERGFVRHKQQK